MSDPEYKPVVRNTTEARAGFWGRRVALVLSISLGSVIVLFVAVYLSFFSKV
jgi:hypothetical protein